MKLGLVSAILPELSLEDVLEFARAKGFACVEAMCWPVGKAERKFAGVTHVDVASLSQTNDINALGACSGVSLSGLGYYPNPLDPDLAAANRVLAHLKTWKPIVAFAEDHSIKVGIENCPMSFSRDEWPGSKNLLTTPVIWRRAFGDIPSKNFGLNYDPSHFVLQQMDPASPLREFPDKLFHLHAKDVKIRPDHINEVGVFVHPLEWHQPRIPSYSPRVPRACEWSKL